MRYASTLFLRQCRSVPQEEQLLRQTQLGSAVPKAGHFGHCFRAYRMSRVLGTLAVSLLLLAFLGTVGADSVSIAVVNGKTTVTASGNSNDACPSAQYQVHDFSLAQFS